MTPLLILENQRHFFHENIIFIGHVTKCDLFGRDFYLKSENLKKVIFFNFKKHPKTMVLMNLIKIFVLNIQVLIHSIIWFQLLSQNINFAIKLSQANWKKMRMRKHNNFLMQVVDWKTWKRTSASSVLKSLLMMIKVKELSLISSEKSVLYWRNHFLNSIFSIALYTYLLDIYFLSLFFSLSVSVWVNLYIYEDKRKTK